MKKRLLSFVLIVFLFFGVFGDIGVRAAENDNYTVTEDTMYVGQTRSLLFIDGEVIKSSKVDYSVVEGSDIIEIEDNSVKALASGKAVLRGVYKKKTVDHIITVLDDPKMKARKIKVNGVKVAVPKDFVVESSAETECVLRSTKNDTGIFIMAAQEKNFDNSKLSQEDWDELTKELSIVIETTCMTLLKGYAQSGLEITDMKYESETIEDGRVRYHFVLKMKNVGNFYLDAVCICSKKGKFVQAFSTGYNKKSVKKAIDYISDKN